MNGGLEYLNTAAHHAVGNDLMPHGFPIIANGYSTMIHEGDLNKEHLQIMLRFNIISF